MVALRMEKNLYEQISADDMEALVRLGLDLEKDPLGNEIPTTGSHTYPNHGLTSTIHWERSTVREVPLGFATGKNLFADNRGRSIPLVGYSEEALDGKNPSPWNAEVLITNSKGGSRTLPLSPAVGYTIYAPQGSISVGGSARAWANPKYKKPDEKEEITEYPGLAVNLMAGSGVEVEGEYPYGFIYNSDGPVELPEAKGVLLKKVEMSDDASPYQELSEAVAAGKSAIENGTLDKTDYIRGEVLEPDGFIRLITGEVHLRDIMSLQQALEFPFLPFPTLVEEEDIYTALLIHFPFESDFKPPGASYADSEAFWKDIEKTADDLSDVAQEIAEGDAVGLLADAPKIAKDIIEDLGDVVDYLKPFLEILEGKVPSFKGDIPYDKSEESEVFKEGWPYWRVIAQIVEDSVRLVDFLENLTSELAKAKADGDPLEILDDLFKIFVPTYRVVHLNDRAPGGKVAIYPSEDPFEEVDRIDYPGRGGFTMSATWNVPRGKTLRWTDNTNGGAPVFTINGSLWIGRGATMVVEGDLKINVPDDEVWSYNSRGGESVERPYGTVYMEEGASLIVYGDLEVEGSRQTGSVMLCSVPGTSHPITQCIIVGGDASFQHGIMPGVVLDDMLEYVAKEWSLDPLQSFNSDFVRPVFDWFVPTAAKLKGPFSTRTSWFASFAQTWVYFDIIAEAMDTVPGIGELLSLAAGPYPLPLPYDNCQNFLFKWISRFYTWELNATLGENLVTHADWWVLGTGFVPAVPKTSLHSVVSDFESAVAQALEPEVVEKEIERFVQQFISKLVKAIVNEVIATTINAALEAVGIGASCGDSSITGGEGEEDDKDIEEIFEEIAEKIVDAVVETMKKQLEAAITSAFHSIRADVEAAFEQGMAQDVLAKELPGVLISARNIYAGSKADSCEFMSGLFLAEKDISFECERTVGVLLSKEGNVNLSGDLNYYPYFSRACLYNPVSVHDYDLFNDENAPELFQHDLDMLNNIAQVRVPIRDGQESDQPETIDVGVSRYHTLSGGFSR